MKRVTVELTEPDGWPNDEQASEFAKRLPCPLPIGTDSNEWIGERLWKGDDGVWYITMRHNEVQG